MTGPALAILIYDLRASGVVKNAIRIAGAARNAGIPTEIWVMRRAGDMLADVAADIVVRPILSGRSTILPRLIDALRGIPALSRAIDAHHPKLLLSAGNHIHMMAIAARGRAAGRTRLIGRASNAPVDPATMLGFAPPLSDFVARRLLALDYRGMDRVVAVSAELGARIAASGVVPSDHIVTIPNGIDLAAAQADATQPVDHPWFDEDMPVVVAIGRLGRQKNFALGLDAFAIARRSRPLRLAIIGAGTPAQQKALERRARRLGIADDVWFAGYRPNPLRYLARAALFLLSSRWEGASNVVLEALACGCPVVATACPTGVREVIDDRDLGIVVPVDDPTAMAAAILARIAAPRAADRLRARAADYDLGRTLDAYVALIREEIAS